MAAYLKDQKRGEELIIAFGAKQGITLNQEQVIAFIDDVDEDEWDIELPPRYSPALLVVRLRIIRGTLGAMVLNRLEVELAITRLDGDVCHAAIDNGF